MTKNFKKSKKVQNRLFHLQIVDDSEIVLKAIRKQALEITFQNETFTPEKFLAYPLSDKNLMACFGTLRPSERTVKNSSAFRQLVHWNKARYVVICDDPELQPDALKVFFAGRASVDSRKEQAGSEIIDYTKYGLWEKDKLNEKSIALDEVYQMRPAMWAAIIGIAVAVMQLIFLPKLQLNSFFMYLFGLGVMGFGVQALVKEETRSAKIFDWAVCLMYLFYVVTFPYSFNLTLLISLGAWAFTFHITKSPGRYVMFAICGIVTLTIAVYSWGNMWRILEFNTLSADHIREISFKKGGKRIVIDSPRELRKITDGLYLYRYGDKDVISKASEKWECEIVMKGGKTIPLTLVIATPNELSERVFIRDENAEPQPWSDEKNLYQSLSLLDALKPILEIGKDGKTEK